MTNQEFIQSITLEGEEWRDVIGYEGLYMVSSYGRIVSLGKYVNNRFKDVYKEPFLCKLTTNPKGTPSFIFSHNGKSFKKHISVLVANTFLNKIDDTYKVLYHIDGDLLNNKVSNLEWRKIKTRRKIYDTSSLICENWKPIYGYEGMYDISSFGRVKSLINGKILKTYTIGYGKYLGITLCKNKTRDKRLIHRLVAASFCENTNCYTEVEHIDGNPQNNHYENLRWCTHAMNMNNPITRKRASKALFGKLNNATSKPVVQIKDNAIINTFPSMAEASRNGFTVSEIARCCLKHSNTHRGYNWMYLSDYETLIKMSKNSLSKPNDI